MVLSLTLAGCPDPRGRFDEFNSRIPDAARNDQIDGAPLPMLPDVTGEFLKGFAVNIAPDLPVRFLVTQALTQNMDGTGTLTLSMQALRVDDHLPVGAPLVPVGPATVNTAGEYTLNFVDVVIPGEANPITMGEVTVTFTLSGRTLSADRVCGEVTTGMITRPLILDIAGSTFAAVRMPMDGTEPPFESTCAVTPTADAGVPDATPGMIDAAPPAPPDATPPADAAPIDASAPDAP